MPRAPRGLKKLLKSTSPVKLSGKGRFKGFELLKHGKPSGQKLAGLTKRLACKIFSNGTLPSIAIRGDERRLGWKGKRGGQNRGKAVDAQLTRCINAGRITPKAGMYSLTKLVLVALSQAGLTPVLCQRGAASASKRIGTAADIVCYNSKSNCIAVVELKCGFSGSRSAAATLSGEKCRMKAPLHKAPDCVLNRHLAQLAVTSHLIQSEAQTFSKLGTIGVCDSNVESVLLYANEQSCDLIPLPDWWKKKAAKILQALG